MKRTKQAIALTLCIAMLMTFIPSAIAASPNSTAGTAIAISPNTTHTDTVQNNWQNSGLKDAAEVWYKTTVTSKGILQFDLSGNSQNETYTSRATFHFYIQDASGQMKNWNITPNSESNFINFDAPMGQTSESKTTRYARVPAGTYFIKLTYGNNTGSKFDFSITPRFTPEGDEYITKFAQTQNTAFSLAVNTPIISTLNYNGGRNVAGADSDWYKIDIAQEGKIQIRIDGVDGKPIDIDARFRAANGGTMSNSFAVTTDNTFAGFKTGAALDVKAGDTYYVVVTPRIAGGGNFNNDYKLTVLFTETIAAPAKHTLTVTSGTGGGSYEKDTKVNITANALAAGKVFDKWTGGNGGTFANANSAATTFTMPDNAATVTATYKDAPANAHVLTVTSGTGGGSYAKDTKVPIAIRFVLGRQGKNDPQRPLGKPRKRDNLSVSVK